MALNAGRIQTATVWRVVKLLFGFSGLDVVAPGVTPSVNRPAAVREESEPVDSIKEVSSRPGTRHQSGNLSFPIQQESGVVTALINGGSGPSGSSAPTSSNERGVSDTSGGVSEEAESEVEDVDSQVLY